MNASEERKSTKKVNQTKLEKKGRISFLKKLKKINRKRLLSQTVATSLILLVGIGAMAQMGLLPYIDKKTSKKYGWFRTELPQNVTNIWNPFANPPPNPTLQLPKEYIYAGDRLLAIEENGGSNQNNRTNHALATNGGTATSSSQFNSNFPPSAANNGDRKGTGYATPDGTWTDGTSGVFPDWLQVEFNGSKTIDEINVITIQNGYTNPIEPTETTTFTSYGITDYQVQYWDGSGWVTIESVTGNDKVWRKFTFTPITTTKIRVYITGAAYGLSNVVELEAWGS